MLEIVGVRSDTRRILKIKFEALEMPSLRFPAVKSTTSQQSGADFASVEAKSQMYWPRRACSKSQK